MSNKHFIVIAGPNGAGKSTTSKRILEEYGIEAFDWDKQVYERWKRFDYDSNETLIQGCKDAATEDFEKHIATAFKWGENVAYETNLHINSHFIRNTKARELGYTTTLIFFLINSTDICEQRVALRVKDGGHFVDRKTIVKIGTDGGCLGKFPNNQRLALFFIDKWVKQFINDLGKRKKNHS